MTDKERFEALLEYLKKEKIVRNQQDFVERIGENRSVVSTYANGKRGFSNAFINRVHKTFPFISEKWLESGEGEMIIEPGTQAPPFIPTSDELQDMGCDSFCMKLLDLISKGEVFTKGSYELQSEEYRNVILQKEKTIEELNQRVGKLEAIIELQRGKKPEDIM